MGNRTGLYQSHEAAGARFVDFGGWDMPLHYGSQIDEHHAVRKSAGVFDVSHMAVIDATGARTNDWLSILLANNIARLEADGDGLYSCMLNHNGGVIDDLIVYRTSADSFRIVVNAGRREADLEWMRDQAEPFAVTLNERTDLAMLAVQGPAAIELATPLLPAELRDAAQALKPFRAVRAGDWFVARTGYTGEDGWEIILPVAAAIELWQALLAAGIQPAGLGARDTLRLEAGLNLYGQDMTESISPLECGLAWTVGWNPESRAFNGRAVLEEQRESLPAMRFVGLVLQDRGIMRAGQKVLVGGGEGEITSGGFSPTLEKSIALARIPAGDEDTCEVEIRNKRVAARVTKTTFVRKGKILIEA